MFEGTAEEALVEAVRANVTHGLPLTLRERRSAAMAVVAAHRDWSDRLIARTCGLSAATVTKVRAAADLSRAAPVVSIARRLGADGRYRPTAPGTIRSRVLEALSERPGASLREIAATANCSPTTVRAIRQRLDQTPTANAASVQFPTRLVHRDGGEAPVGKNWEHDSACASSDRPRRFAVWFDRTRLEPEDLYQQAQNVPLSRIYEVADEARRRSKLWSEFASAVEDRGRHPGGRSGC
jgi:hypothetical protein